FESLHRRFTNRVYTWLVDLDHLPQLPWWLRPLARFRAADHLGSAERSIRENVDVFLANRGIDLAGGRVVLLANAATLGYVFNPLSVYWCYLPTGELRCVLAEVHNTYGERHCYLLEPDEFGRVEVDKQFYVSPFFEVDGHYRMRFSEPGRSVSISVVLRRGGRTAFSASVRGVRGPAGTLDVLRAAMRRPLMSQRVTALIYRHGITLWLKHLPIMHRPVRVPDADVVSPMEEK
ncbi:MAG: DUF1365 domain-containing protein, partial [Sciscionella sp.]